MPEMKKLTPQELAQLRYKNIVQRDRRFRPVNTRPNHEGGWLTAQFPTRIKALAANPIRGTKARTVVQTHNLFIKKLLKKAGAR